MPLDYGMGYLFWWCYDSSTYIKTFTMTIIVEQNHAWSEEDEKNLLEISCLIGNYRTGDDEYKLDSWLNSLKNRVQSKQEWSEDDEIMFRKAIITIDNVRMNTGSSEYYQGICNWLISLKDRYTWKPSDEQMLAVNTAINVLGKGTLNGKQLIELEEQLKKLRDK